MEQRIINALAVALDAVFPDIPILDETAEQDIGRPAFFISPVEAVLTERIKHAGFFMRYRFDLIYDPGVKNADTKCRMMKEELMLLLRRIPDLESEFAFRPTEIRFETVEGELHAIFDVIEAIIPDREEEEKVKRVSSKTEINSVQKN